ncbi:MAG: 16S rRNA (cytidine(1402)-2'-O)-methyltransferase [Clostridiales bacterium]|nr:16S rRNA (cytidine(1402)-2'-O)-methyltransferase [Clostridiales bacterium]
MNGKFYFVGTPIGNLKDFSQNQKETLESVDVILCEDTRTSRVLLNHYNINKELLSYHKFNYKTMNPKVIEILKSNKNVALISDAGMPVISDPGAEIIQELIKNGIEYTVIGGVSAFVNAFILSGFTYPFTFLGFLPEKNKEIKNFLMEYINLNSTLIFYSSVHNLNNDIQTLYKFLGDRKICVARELTKHFEEVKFSTLKEGINITNKGEFVIVIDKPIKNEDEDNKTLDEKLEYYLSLGYSKNDSIKQIAKDKKMSKSEVYNYFVKKD